MRIVAEGLAYGSASDAARYREWIGAILGLAGGSIADAAIADCQLRLLEGRGASDKQIAQAFGFLNEQRKSGRNVLVHCQFGHTRSVSIVCGYLAWQRGVTLEEVWRELEAEDPQIRREEELFHSLAAYLERQAKWYRR